MEIVGYIASLAIGISLGLIGGGGSILTVPVLVYLFDVEPVVATAYSLFIVGATSLAGVFPKYRMGEVQLRAALAFGMPSMIAVFVTRKLLVPAIPPTIAQIGDFTLTKSIFMMLLFALLMIAAAFSMLRNGQKKETAASEVQPFNYPLLLLAGALEGTLTGVVGAGGGFLIIPALVLLSHLPMKQAIGTSLLIIAVKSLIGFTGDLSHTAINWSLLLSVAVLAIAGIILGNELSKKISPARLKRGFAWFVLLMGAYVIIKELLFP